MATKHKDSVPAGNKEIKRGPSPVGSASTHRIRPTPSSPSGTSIAKDHSKTQGLPKSSNTVDKHVPNYLKPTISSKTDVAKLGAVSKKQHSHDDMHKPNSASVRRRSFDQPVVPASHVHKAIHQSSSRVGVATSISVKNNSASVVAKPSSERVAKVVKAVKSQPPLVKTKSLPKNIVAGSRNKPSEQTPDIVKSEMEEDESLDVNVEEELAKMESPSGPHDLQPPETHLEHNVNDDVNHSPQAAHYVNDRAEQHQRDDQEQELVAEDVKVSNEIQNVDETNQQNNGAIDNASAEDDTGKEEEEGIMKADVGVGLTVKTTPDEVVEGEDQSGLQGEDEKLSAKSEVATSVVHKRQTGGLINKKESPVYNDVIEETASKLVEKKVNKVRALAGAFETVISLEQPHSS